ncbi:cytochrome c [bacterium]|nr:cytochrome c [bacterium]
MKTFVAFGLLATALAIPNAYAEDPPPADTPQFLDQGWNDEQRSKFYFTPQGSHLIPWDFFLNLEQSDSSKLFADPDNMDRLRFVVSPKSDLNPDGLPVGFVKDGANQRFGIKRAYLGKNYRKVYQKSDMFGLTCAACHTSQIEYDGKVLQIDGGAAMSDFERFLKELSESLEATLGDNEKFNNFARRLNASEGDKDKLRIRLTGYSKKLSQLVKRNKADQPYGFARLDAFGAILNAVCELAVDNDNNHVEANAPVSYPTLWDAPHYDFVQWNATAPEALGRNVGEVLGVFGFFDLRPGKRQFDSTVRLKELQELEDLLRSLKSPHWPEDVFGALDSERVTRGKQLFNTNCASCHQTRNDNGEFSVDARGRIKTVSVPFKTGLVPGKHGVDTDAAMVENFIGPKAEPGNLKEAVEKQLLGQTPPGALDNGKAPRPVILTVAVGSIIRKLLEKANISPPANGPAAPAIRFSGAAYISRPLNGIWASAPYFHNGSVPNLWETLLPASKRSKTFYVGSRKFDPKHVGFETEKTPGAFLFQSVDNDGKVIRGNSNAGHEGHGDDTSQGYTETFENNAWREFTDEERWDLVEFMKSLK